jgi:Caspase domain
MSYLGARSGPAVHALVIGVGAYPYLAGGRHASPTAELDFPEMRQLTSPPRSALAFARQLMTGGQGRWNLPLGSLDLLVSCAPDDPFPEAADLPYRDATIDNIRIAFESWAERSSAHPDSIAVLYFCGHGLQSGSHLLLASDFNRFGASPFAQAFDFDLTRLALQQSGPRTQCFVIDACRTDCLDRAPAGAAPLAQPSPFRARVCENELVLRMPPFDEATARLQAVSHLTAALLRALDGQAATTDDAGDWVIRTADVHRAIGVLFLEEIGVSSLASGVEAQSNGGAVLLRLPEAPVTRLTVNCRPVPTASLTTLTCVPADPPGGPEVHCGEPFHGADDGSSRPSLEWQMEVRAGFYVVSAQSATTKVSRLHGAYPPRSRAILEMAPCE